MSREEKFCFFEGGHVLIVAELFLRMQYIYFDLQVVSIHLLPTLQLQ